MSLPSDSQERKDTPIVRGVLDYFPDAIAAVARVSKAGNDKHNPGEEMHHARGKSTDHADCIVRHLMERGEVDPEDGHRHSAKVAWRALALLQEEIEREEGTPLARGARLPDEGPEAPNNIHERIAGDTPTARKIKNEYYGGTPFMPGTPVRHSGGWQGVVLPKDDPLGEFTPPYRAEASDLDRRILVKYTTTADGRSFVNPKAFFCDFDLPEKLEIL